jgi:hypothetical protein
VIIYKRNNDFGKEAIMMKNIKNAIEHLREHQEYPATKEEITETCNKLEDFSEEDKKWFAEHLPERVYKSPEEVIQALGWEAQTAQAI